MKRRMVQLSDADVLWMLSMLSTRNLGKPVRFHPDVVVLGIERDLTFPFTTIVVGGPFPDRADETEFSEAHHLKEEDLWS